MRAPRMSTVGASSWRRLRDCRFRVCGVWLIGFIMNFLDAGAAVTLVRIAVPEQLRCQITHGPILLKPSPNLAPTSKRTNSGLLRASKSWAAVKHSSKKQTKNP